MSSSNARIVLKRGSAALFGSLSYRQQTVRSFSRLIPGPNSSNSASSRPFLYDISHLVKSNGKGFFLADTLAMVRRLEAQGMPSQHAESIISTMVRNVSKKEMQKEHNFSLQRETEKHQVDIEKLFSGIFAESEFGPGSFLYQSDLARMEKTRSELSKAMREDVSPIVTEIRAFNAYLEEEINRTNKQTIVMVLVGGGVFGAGLALSKHRRERANRRERA